MRRLVPGLLAGVVGLAATLHTGLAAAQEAPDRSEAWDDASLVLALSAMGMEVLMPRVFYSDPEVTAGWKARWHVSVLAPSMTFAAVGFVNEEALKDAFGGLRPDCTEETQGGPGCTSYGMLSTHTFLAFSAFGQGLGVFLSDTLKWSHGKFNFGGFAGNTAIPGVLALVTAAGRTAGNWEQPGQVWGTAGIGMLTGLGMGAIYGLAQRPECGYSGALVCW
jgi:hypothetical protein